MSERGGLPWYCIWSEFSGHTKTRELCALVKDRNAGMYVVRLFEHCAEHALDGRIPAHIIEDVASWRGKAGALLAALEKAKVLEVDGEVRVVHGWVERNGSRIQKWMRDNAKPRGNKPKSRVSPATVPHGTSEGFAGVDVDGDEAEALPPPASAREPGHTSGPEAADVAPPPPAAEAVSGPVSTCSSSLDGERGSGQPEPVKRADLRSTTGAPQLLRDTPLVPASVAAEWPLTAELLERLEASGREAAFSREKATRRAVEKAVASVGVDVAFERIAAAWDAPRPWLGWYLDAIEGRPTGGRRSAPAPKREEPLPDGPPAFVALLKRAAASVASETFRRDLALARPEEHDGVLWLVPVDECHELRMTDPGMFGKRIPELAAQVGVTVKVGSAARASAAGGA